MTIYVINWKKRYKEKEKELDNALRFIKRDHVELHSMIQRLITDVSELKNKSHE